MYRQMVVIVTPEAFCRPSPQFLANLVGEVTNRRVIRSDLGIPKAKGA